MRQVLRLTRFDAYPCCVINCICINICINNGLRLNSVAKHERRKGCHTKQ